MLDFGVVKWGYIEMFDVSDSKTVYAAKLLFDKIAIKEEGIVLWIGAGASSWSGYPLWKDLALKFHTDYQRYDPSYDVNNGLKLINDSKFPEYFQECKDLSITHYNELLSENFKSKQITPVYSRFIKSVRDLAPKCILTTNVDDLLEKNLPSYTLIEKSNIERCHYLLKNNEPFICKLHGSMDKIQSVVFTSEDYSNLESDESFIKYLERIISASTLIFIGYGLQDEYLISLLQKNQNLATLFGDGPHFAILPNITTKLPSSVKILRYLPIPHKDHRTTISIIEELKFRRPKIKKAKFEHEPAAKENLLRSAHLLFDVLPPGTWTSSHTIELEGQQSQKIQAIVGNGFTTKEVSDHRSTAMHDFLVGLICFDQVIAPIQSLGRLHILIGSDRFWGLVRDDIVTFINWQQNEAVFFPSPDSINSGDLGTFSTLNSDMTKKTVKDQIRSHLKPSTGNEHEAEKLFEELEPKIYDICDTPSESIPNIVRSLLLRPSIRNLLGISGGTPLNSITRWQVFSILRLANVVRIGSACRNLMISSAKLDFGTSNLAGPAFASAAGVEFTDDSASYVVCGRFNCDLGNIVSQDVTLIDSVLAFRDTIEGINLRKEILKNLAISSSADVNIAVNSALIKSIPNKLLQEARDKFVSLLTPQKSIGSPISAIWNNDVRAEESINKWKQTSREILKSICQKNGITSYDPCPCGSGEKLKFCCEEALLLNSRA